MPVYDSSGFSPPAPLAKISLRDHHADKMCSDVAMLIDTGADVTLIPREAVFRLGIFVDPSQGYELMGFDGSTSRASVVELDLIFMKRIFRGKLLIIDQAIGILGRDILNHLSLVLDGPNLSWDERS